MRFRNGQHQLKKLGVLDVVALVDEHNDVRHTDLP